MPRYWYYFSFYSMRQIMIFLCFSVLQQCTTHMLTLVSPPHLVYRTMWWVDPVQARGYLIQYTINVIKTPSMGEFLYYFILHLYFLLVCFDYSVLNGLLEYDLRVLFKKYLHLFCLILSLSKQSPLLWISIKIVCIFLYPNLARS